MKNLPCPNSFPPISVEFPRILSKKHWYKVAASWKLATLNLAWKEDRIDNARMSMYRRMN